MIENFFFIAKYIFVLKFLEDSWFGYFGKSLDFTFSFLVFYIGKVFICFILSVGWKGQDLSFPLLFESNFLFMTHAFEYLNDIDYGFVGKPPVHLLYLQFQ